jgi:polar amino acid transport system substrate-binding protein
MTAKAFVISLLVVHAVLFNFSCTDTTAPSKPVVQKPQTVFERVATTRTLRAAYITYPPAVMRDPQTKKLNGIFVETLEQAAENLGWKVQWTEEVGWGAQIEGLQTDRYDIVGSPVWANATRARLTTLSRPVYYSGIGIYVRKGDKRFLKSLTAIDDPKVRIATIDGETGDLIARTQFPKARRVSLPQLADISEAFLQITTGKADVAFAEPYYGEAFLKANPNSITNIADKKPIKTLGNCYMLKAGEPQLKQALDVALEDLQNSGFVDRLLDKYEPSPNTFYRVAQPYRIVPTTTTTTAVVARR